MTESTSKAEQPKEKDKAHTSSDYYWDSYAHFGIHEEMLKDEVRTKSYRDAIIRNAHMFKDKVVMDVGCGTGILSLFAAKAGAKRVIAVECSSIAEQATEIVKHNKYDHVVTVVKGKVEDITLPDGIEKVDIIISEWMGYFLLYESMLNTVLVARDKFLAEGGSLFPDKATMYIAGIEDAVYKDEKIGFWENVYGFDFSPIKRLALLEPLVDIVDQNQLMTTNCCFNTIDINTVKLEDLTFDCEWTVDSKRRDCLHAFVVWFDVQFAAGHQTHSFSTGPFTKYTHWKQTVFYTKEVLVCESGDKISGKISCKPNANNHRDLDIALSVKHKEVDFTQDFRLR